MSSYNTKQKQLVLELIKNNAEKQLSCDDITYLLVNNGTPVGKTTVYRQLEKLVQDGMLKKLTSHNSKSHIYQYLDKELNCEKHMHLRCRICGKFEHLSCDFMDKVSEHIFAHHNFKVDNADTVINGVCNTCACERSGDN